MRQDISRLGQEDSVDIRMVLEVLQDTHSLKLGSAAMNVWLLQLLRVGLKRRLDRYGPAAG
jgi:hypothetical protein